MPTFSVGVEELNNSKQPGLTKSQSALLAVKFTTKMGFKPPQNPANPAPAAPTGWKKFNSLLQAKPRLQDIAVSARDRSKAVPPVDTSVKPVKKAPPVAKTTGGKPVRMARTDLVAKRAANKVEQEKKSAPADGTTKKVRERGKKVCM